MSVHIDELDVALLLDGEDVVLRRVIGKTNQAKVDVTCRAFVRGYAPDRLTGGVIQGDSLVIISPTQINGAQWPGGQPPGVAGDARVPRKGDKVIAQGRVRNVEAAAPIYVAGELVRLELQVRG